MSELLPRWKIRTERRGLPEIVTRYRDRSTMRSNYREILGYLIYIIDYFLAVVARVRVTLGIDYGI